MTAVGDFLAAFVTYLGWMWLAFALLFFGTVLWFLFERRVEARRDAAMVLARNARVRASAGVSEELGERLAAEAQAYLAYREEML